jgi:uncharacterized protein HemX
MKPRRTWSIVAVAILIALAAGIGLARAWSETQALRAEVELARTEAGELSRLRSENRRLREKQIPAAELSALRADHAALERLRGELQSLKERAK